MTREEPPIQLLTMEPSDTIQYPMDVLYDCITKFDNGYYDAWFEEHNAYEVADKIRFRLIHEMMLHYETHPASIPMNQTMESAYKNYLRFYLGKAQ